MMKDFPHRSTTSPRSMFGISHSHYDHRVEHNEDSKHQIKPIDDYFHQNVFKNRRGRPRKHAPKISLPPLYIFIR